MGRARKPLAQQKGHLKTEFVEQRKFEESLTDVGNSELDTPPEWLIDDVARAEFVRVAGYLKEIGFIGSLDISNIGGYCNAYAMYCKATKALKKAPLKVNGGNGQATENPLINIQQKYAREMRDFEKLCGLTADSRLKFASIKAEQIDDDIKDKFGDI